MILSSLEDSVPTTSDARLLSTSEELLREQVAFLQERVGSLQHLVEQLNSELLDKQQQIQALEQELMLTNNDLSHALAHLPESSCAKQPARQIWQEETASESLDELIEAIYDYIIYAKELDIVKIAVKANTSLNVLVKQAAKKSEEAIARSKELRAEYNELGFKFVSFKANFIQSQERTERILSQVRQSKDEDKDISFQSLKDYSNKPPENFNQLTAHRHRIKELVGETKDCIEQTKLELTKLRSLNKNNAKVRSC